MEIKKLKEQKVNFIILKSGIRLEKDIEGDYKEDFIVLAVLNFRGVRLTVPLFQRVLHERVYYVLPRLPFYGYDLIEEVKVIYLER
jgi:hypothetical protein